MRLRDFLAENADVWVQPPDEGEPWYAAHTALSRVPTAHLEMAVWVSQSPGVDAGLLWLDEAALGYRWARALGHTRGG